MNTVIFGKGFIGNHIYNHLKNESDIGFYSRADIDYSNNDKLKKFLNEHKDIKFVINCCGYTGHPNVDACETNQQDCLFYNLNVPANINSVCIERKIQPIHVSSGCIYTGYNKDFTEEDAPTFGLFNKEASFYSKTKHLFEMACRNFLNNITILRIRMPYTDTKEHKNYLYKILQYDNLIDNKNSITYVNDVGRFVDFVIKNQIKGTYNVVNDGAVSASQVVELFKKNDIKNDKWNFVDFKALKTRANRSNCILSNKKVKDLGFNFSDTLKSVEDCIIKLK